MCTDVEFHTSYVCTYFSTALPVTVLNTSGQLRIAMVLHFVSYDFLWFGELRCWKTSADNFEKLRRRTTVFTSTDIQLRTLNFVFCHFTAMDAWTSNRLIFVHCNFIPGAISGKCGELALHVFLDFGFSPEALRAN